MNYTVGQWVQAVEAIIATLDSEGEHTETLALKGHPLVIREILLDEFFEAKVSWDQDCPTTFSIHFAEIAPL